ncbi:MAG: flagellar filament capping protein FliD [Oscillospiraceae bacterium]|nr:flagellar filament capping protein FliD [Oscillospiraceae bacterium]
MSVVSGINSYIMNSYYGNSMKNPNGNISKDPSALSDALRNSAVNKQNPLANKNSEVNKIAEKLFGRRDEKNSEKEKLVAESAAALEKSAGRLAAGDTFAKDNKGKYNIEAISKNVSDFVNDYNDTVNALKDSKSSVALDRGEAMGKTMSSYKNSLSRIGISINDDNTLSVDKDKLSKADPQDVKNVFGGNYSISAKTVNKAQDINAAAKFEMNGTYDRDGRLASYSGTMVTALLSTNV